jgi:TP901-1 family phage major tail protein
MAAQKGLLFLLQIGDGGTPTELFTSLASARETSFTHNNEVVDITAKDQNGWREILEGAGMKSVSVSISGVFKDTAVEESFRAAASAGNVDNYRIISGTGDYWEGPFIITSYERGGSYNGEEIFSATLENAGAVTFEAA